MSFSYHALYRTGADQPSGLIAMRVWTGPLEAVVWSVPKGIWMYAPELAAPRIFDDRYEDRTRPVDRPEAERIARDLLGTTLPEETELLAMCEERRTS